MSTKTKPRPLTAAQQWPELQTLALRYADDVCSRINNDVPHAKTCCVYPAQCTLELLIRELQRRV